MDPFDIKNKSQGTATGGVSTGTTSPTATPEPMAEEPTVPSGGVAGSTILEEPVAPTVEESPTGTVTTPEPDLSVPPAPPVESSEPVTTNEPLTGVGGGVSEEPDRLTKEVSDEEPTTPTLGQISSKPEPDETSGTGGTGLAGE